MRLYPPGAPISPSGAVVMARCGRRGIIVRKRVELPRDACTWCGGAVVRPRRRWCGAACVEAFYATQPIAYVSRVRRRDAGKPCEICGERGGYREVDHRVPIAEGGHPFDLDNLRLIHGHCHRGETRALAGRLAQRRRTGA